MFYGLSGGIQCCRFCGPPKRSVGCHATCENYIQEKKEYDEKQAQYRKELGEIIDQDYVSKARKHRYMTSAGWKKK